MALGYAPSSTLSGGRKVCSACGARSMTLEEVDPPRLQPPSVCLGDFKRALKRAKANVNASNLVRHDDWTREFGMEGN